MGWSCSLGASDSLETIERYCRNGSTGMINVFSKRKTSWYFYEVDKTEYQDGRITGKVYKRTLAGTINAGEFLIDNVGNIREFPHLPKNWVRNINSGRRW